MIKAVIFDFFGVICSDEYWQFVKADRNMDNIFHDLQKSVNLGVISWQDFLQKVADRTGKNVNAVKHLYESEQINLPLVAYINQLGKKYKTALLTNASSQFMQPLLEKTGLKDIFDEVVVSSEIGIIKPNPRIYQYALEKLGVEPAEAVFIDDFEARVQGARDLGMHTILYQNFPQMKAELKKILAAGADN